MALCAPSPGGKVAPEGGRKRNGDILIPEGSMIKMLKYLDLYF